MNENSDRRLFLKGTTLLLAQSGMIGNVFAAGEAKANVVGEGLTRYVAEFICNTQFENIPASTLALGKKSFLDGLGLAISGSATELGDIVRKHIASLNIRSGPAIIIGTISPPPLDLRHLQMALIFMLMIMMILSLL